MKAKKTSLKARKKENTIENSVTPDENLMARTLKSQQSAFVKEKIKEILEDGQKKTFITLRSCESSQVENRISVIKSISSTINCEDQLRSYTVIV